LTQSLSYVSTKENKATCPDSLPRRHFIVAKDLKTSLKAEKKITNFSLSVVIVEDAESDGW